MPGGGVLRVQCIILQVEYVFVLECALLGVIMLKSEVGL